MPPGWGQMSLEAPSRSFGALEEGRRKQPGRKRVLNVSAPDIPPRWEGPAPPRFPDPLVTGIHRGCKGTVWPGLLELGPLPGVLHL